MQTQTINNYDAIKNQIETLNEIELIEVIDFINFLQHKKKHKQRRLAILEQLRTQNVTDIFGDALAWQNEIRQDKKLEGRE
jgi:hypothetical protein